MLASSQFRSVGNATYAPTFTHFETKIRTLVMQSSHLFIATTQHEQSRTSSSLYQDKLSAVKTNQYSLEPPFMMLMLLIVSQPRRMTWKGKGKQGEEGEDGIIGYTLILANSRLSGLLQGENIWDKWPNELLAPS